MELFFNLLMITGIESFVNTLPIVNGWDEAKRRYIESLDVSDFSRVELYGAFELSRAGVQMVYLIGRGKVEYSSEKTDSLFYFNCMITKDFFKKEKNGDEVKAIPINRIKEIRLVQVSEDFWWRPGS